MIAGSGRSSDQQWSPPSLSDWHESGRCAEGVAPGSMARLLSVFRRHGLELRGAAGGHPATLICNDPTALDDVRAANGKSVGAGE